MFDLEGMTKSLLKEGLKPVTHFPLAPLTWWKVGGPADLFLKIPTLTQLKTVQRLAHTHLCPVFVLGAGSNILVSDTGYRGLVIMLEGEFTDSLPHGDELHLGAGLRLSVALNRARKYRWPGLQVLAGIPGTIGGAVKMNAGSHLGEVSDILRCVEVITTQGEQQIVSRQDCHLGYRKSGLPVGSVVTKAVVVMSGDIEESMEKITKHLEYRKSTQPLAQKTIGSTFANPIGDYAGRLIEEAGLKGKSIGGAEVSSKHANFILNRGNATARDLRQLIELVQEEVQIKFGIDLRPEVQMIGQW